MAKNYVEERTSPDQERYIQGQERISLDPERDKQSQERNDFCQKYRP